MLKGVRRGLTITELLVVIAIIGTLTAILLPAVQKVRATADRMSCANNLHQIGLALQHYHDVQRAFPPGVTSPQSRDPYPWMCWQTRLLPYVEQLTLWDYTQDAYAVEPSPFNDPPHTGLSTIMRVYACPSDTRAFTPQDTYRDMRVALTSYVGVLGTTVNKNDGILFIDSHIAIRDIRDGTSQTLIVGERPASADCWYGWWYAGKGQKGTGSLDAVLGVRELNLGDLYVTNCPLGPYHIQPGRLDQQSDVFHFWSLHDGGANFLFADGAVHFLDYGVDNLLPALATRSGGETVDVP